MTRAAGVSIVFKNSMAAYIIERESQEEWVGAIAHSKQLQTSFSIRHRSSDQLSSFARSSVTSGMARFAAARFRNAWTGAGAHGMRDAKPNQHITQKRFR